MFKINISEKTGKTYHLEAEAKELIEKKLHDKVGGEDISQDLNGYEFEITGASDKSGFTAMENVEGVNLKKVLLTYGKAMKKKPRKEGKKKLSKNRPKGLRLRKTVRGKIISEAISQINLKVLKEGKKKLSEIFPEQGQGKSKENRKTKRTQAKAEPVKEEPVKEKSEEAKKEKIKDEIKEETAEKKEEVKEIQKEEPVKKAKEEVKEEPVEEK